MWPFMVSTTRKLSYLLAVAALLLLVFATAHHELRVHFFGLLQRAWNLFTEKEGTTTPGFLSNIAWPVISLAVALILIRRERGKSAAVNYLEEIWLALRVIIIVALLVYGPMAIWATVRTVYDDHHNLAGRLQGVLNEKHELQNKLDNAKCPTCEQCPTCVTGNSSGHLAEERISSLIVEARMTCTIKPGVDLPPSSENIIAGFGTGSLVGVGGTVELARTNPVEFLKQRENEMVVVNHFYVPNSESLIGSPISRILNFETLIAPFTVLGSGELIDRVHLVEVTVTINNKHTWYYPYKIGDIPFRQGLTATIPLGGIEKVIH